MLPPLFSIHRNARGYYPSPDLSVLVSEVVGAIYIYVQKISPLFVPCAHAAYGLFAG